MVLCFTEKMELIEKNKPVRYHNNSESKPTKHMAKQNNREQSTRGKTATGESAKRKKLNELDSPFCILKLSIYVRTVLTSVRD